ncbi:MAG: methylmalonyl Co-A mutase-associated GTPase MeaB [Candidatus Nitrosocaldaceae archaeon]|nr:MAG: methylmalonyl Co-A mutase-associated GTPase MeaB [Candidatus Nitrosocaldaceae archaeon]
MNISKALLEGKRVAIAKALSVVEDDLPESRELIKEIIENIGNARTIGITGPAGAGKSTLIDKLIEEYRKRDFKVAVLAIDPTSAISGGAILGDRVRMQQHTLDDNIFIRSMASRGALGGISRSVRNAIRVLDAAGFKRIIIESVGAGQLDIEITKIVDVTLVLFNPQTGDSIQAIKAGLTEIGDIYIVNKADLDGAEKLYYDIKDLIVDKDDKLLFKTVALEGKGIKELVDGIEEVLEKKSSKYKELEKKRIEMEVIDLVNDIVSERLRDILKDNELYNKYLKMILAKKIDPYTAAEEIASSIIK